MKTIFTIACTKDIRFGRLFCFWILFFVFSCDKNEDSFEPCRLTKVSSERGYSLTFNYDESGRLIWIEDAITCGGYKITYDPQSRIIKKEGLCGDQLYSLTTFSYDEPNVISVIEDPDVSRSTDQLGVFEIYHDDQNRMDSVLSYDNFDYIISRSYFKYNGLDLVSRIDSSQYVLKKVFDVEHSEKPNPDHLLFGATGELPSIIFVMPPDVWPSGVSFHAPIKWKSVRWEADVRGVFPVDGRITEYEYQYSYGARGAYPESATSIVDGQGNRIFYSYAPCK